MSLNVILAYFCSSALHNGVYKMVGKMLVVCLVQGGVSPNFFSERLYRQICGSSPLPGSMEEVMDHTLKEKLQKASKLLIYI